MGEVRMVSVVRQFLALSLGLLLVFSFAGCGGSGGGDGDGDGGGGGGGTPTTYTISGTITDGSGTPIAEVSVFITGGVTSNTLSDVNGNYSFANLPAGNYSIEVGKTGVIFPVSIQAVTISTSDRTINFSGTVGSYTISGTIMIDNDGDGAGDVAAASLTVNLNGDNSVSGITDVNGDYSFTGLLPGSYTVSPGDYGYVYNPTQLNVTLTGADQQGKDFVATGQYTISGTITDGVNPLDAVDIIMGGDSTGATTTDANGFYSITVQNGSYSVAPSKDGYAFTPVALVVNVAGADQTDQDFTGAVAAATHDIGGYVYFDTNNINTGNVPLPGVTVNLFESTNLVTPIGVSLTRSDGAFFFPGLAAGGNYTITPVSSYTLDVNSQSVTGLDVSKTLFFTATGACYTISGNISMINGGSNVENATVTVELPIPFNGDVFATTDASGDYTIDCLPNGDYTLIPYIVQSWMFPQTNDITISDANLSNQDFSAAIGRTITGSISYSGAQTGWAFLRVYRSGSDTSWGTAVQFTGPGTQSYTIRGLSPDNNYTVEAFLDTIGEGQANASHPTGSSAQFDVSSAGQSGIDVTLTDPATPVPTVPTISSIIPASGTALIFYSTPADGNDVELADSYKIYYGINSSLTPQNAVGFFTVSATGENDEGVAFLGGLTDATTYYFTVAALLTNPPTETATSAASSVLVGARTGGSTVSGTLTVPVSAQGKQISVGLFNDSIGVYYDSISSATATEAFSITGVTNGTYTLFVLVDMDASGHLNVGDLFQDSTILSVSGDVANNNITLIDGNAEVELTTTHRTDNSNNDGYSVEVEVDRLKKQPVKMELNGPYFPGTIDLASFGGDARVWQDMGSTRPALNAQYSVTITYSDLFSETLDSSINTVLDSFPTPTYPLSADNNTGDTAPTFAWTAPADPPTVYFYGLRISEDSGGSIWWADELPSTTTSVLFNNDDEASQSALTLSTQYNWSISIQDGDGNRAEYQVQYTP
ncbi:carboxypeptidase regulatory-like domain-containing protein [Thermodesulfobacteriota bacterium]